MFAATYAIIFTVAWLYNREIEKALSRALASETALRKERDLLEARVSERAEELERAHNQRLLEMHRFADIGRHASGLFHDLLNPLTAQIIYLEQLNLPQNKTKKASAANPEASLQRILEVSKRMESYVRSVRKQLTAQEHTATFSPHAEILSALDVLAYRLRTGHCAVTAKIDERIVLRGNPVKFYKLVLNLVTNAVDSYEGQDMAEKTILIVLAKTDDHVELRVTDKGIGISPADLPRIFEPFYTTKNIEKGTGLGLAICKEVVEKDFSGTLAVTSQVGKGSTFVARFPAPR